MDMRVRLGSHISGSGVEVGPGHNPFPVPEGVSVRYIDRWWPDENRALWPDMVDPTFPQPDLVADFDTVRLPLADASQDFVVCSHVLEHLADPIGFLADMYRVLRAGGAAVVLLPDRRYTFDATRAPTTFEHLVSDYREGMTEVSDEHIADYLGALSHDEGNRYQLAMSYDLHRKRSVHVHCWTDEEFRPVVEFTIDQLNLSWECVDWVPTEGIEFGLVLKKARSPRTASSPWIRRRRRRRTTHAGNVDR